MPFFSCRFVTLLACAACLPLSARGQDAPAYPPPQYPAPQYPSQQYPAQSYPQQAGYPAPTYAPVYDNTGRKGRMRQFFAGTLAAVLQGSGVSSAAGLSDMVVGGISEWFDHKQRRREERRQAKALAAAQPNYQGGQVPPPQAGSPAYSPPADVPAPAYTPDPQYPQPQYNPQPQYEANAAPAYSPDAAQQYTPVQFYDSQTGDASAAPTYAPAYSPAYASTDAPVYSAAAPEQMAQPYSPPADDTLYAGMAYEIHALRPDGSALPVNPATYEFHTGDQFMVLYRPSLPGRMRVVNVNPAGRETEIDNVDVAAGQLMRLGPYRFEATRGDEALRFLITPCSSPALYVATRDIVKVDGAAATGGLDLGSCNAAATRSIRGPATRDIRKVAVEGNTGFAFDPVSSQELQSGQLAPREFTVMFRHR